MPVGADERLNGWKAIGRYFGRERSTVMRWARDRGLPVRRLPGASQGSVFALRSELDAWSLRHAGTMQDRTDAATDAAAVPMVAPVDDAHPITGEARRGWLSSWPRRFALIAATAVLLTITGLGAETWRQSSGGGRYTLPPDPSIAQMYVAANDARARRTAADLRRAVTLYREVIRRAPDYAPAWGGLAESWVLINEYGEVAGPVAFPAARAAAQRAIELDPRQATPYRVLGYLDYWINNDGPAAVASFARAIALGPDDMENHFWYANVLANMGQAIAAEREYTSARMLAPGSQPIAVEHACAQWEADRDAIAERLLTDLARRYPQDATVAACLGWIYLSRGDGAAVARAWEAKARLRGEPELTLLSQRMTAAAGDPASALKVLSDDSVRRLTLGLWTARDSTAFHASAAGDRAALVRVLRDAAEAHEQWYSAPITTRIARRWNTDAEILGLIRRLTPAAINLPAIEAEGRALRRS